MHRLKLFLVPRVFTLVCQVIQFNFGNTYIQSSQCMKELGFDLPAGLDSKCFVWSGQSLQLIPVPTTTALPSSRSTDPAVFARRSRTHWCCCRRRRCSTSRSCFRRSASSAARWCPRTRAKRRPMAEGCWSWGLRALTRSCAVASYSWPHPAIQCPSHLLRHRAPSMRNCHRQGRTRPRRGSRICLMLSTTWNAWEVAESRGCSRIWRLPSRLWPDRGQRRDDWPPAERSLCRVRRLRLAADADGGGGGATREEAEAEAGGGRGRRDSRALCWPCCGWGCSSVHCPWRRCWPRGRPCCPSPDFWWSTLKWGRRPLSSSVCLDQGSRHCLSRGGGGMSTQRRRKMGAGGILGHCAEIQSWRNVKILHR